jgi:hypothetical protein
MQLLVVGGRIVVSAGQLRTADPIQLSRTFAVTAARIARGAP